ncbi:MAG TPA: hypothetical protein PKA10_12170 [Selenomonadales bacterium]|nr:hypothetical protein [Selenomonadales bacterium]
MLEFQKEMYRDELIRHLQENGYTKIELPIVNDGKFYLLECLTPKNGVWIGQLGQGIGMAYTNGLRLNEVTMNKVNFPSIIEPGETFNQAIKEYLLRKAVRYTDINATGILFFLEDAAKELAEGAAAEIDLYFLQQGVDWQYDYGKVVDAVPKYYRFSVKIIYNSKDKRLTIYEKPGNV